jgi:hypothetical protein
LLAAVFTSPTPSNPRHGTFGVSGLDGSFIAWACVGLCAIGLLCRLSMRVWNAASAPAGVEDHRGDCFGSTMSNAI